MSDLISRQAAIDAFDCAELTPDGGVDANDALEILERLPSAQPEIIRCKDCKRHNIDIGDFREDGDTVHWFWKDEACPLVQYRGKAQGEEYDRQYCSYAERKGKEK